MSRWRIVKSHRHDVVNITTRQRVTKPGFIMWVAFAGTMAYVGYSKVALKIAKWQGFIDPSELFLRANFKYPWMIAFYGVVGGQLVIDLRRIPFPRWLSPRAYGEEIASPLLGEQTPPQRYLAMGENQTTQAIQVSRANTLWQVLKGLNIGRKRFFHYSNAFLISWLPTLLFNLSLGFPEFEILSDDDFLWRIVTGAAIFCMAAETSFTVDSLEWGQWLYRPPQAATPLSRVCIEEVEEIGDNDPEPGNNSQEVRILVGDAPPEDERQEQSPTPSNG